LKRRKEDGDRGKIFPNGELVKNLWSEKVRGEEGGARRKEMDPLGKG